MGIQISPLDLFLYLIEMFMSRLNMMHYGFLLNIWYFDDKDLLQKIIIQNGCSCRGRLIRKIRHLLFLCSISMLHYCFFEIYMHRNKYTYMCVYRFRYINVYVYRLLCFLLCTSLYIRSSFYVYALVRLVFTVIFAKGIWLGIHSRYISSWLQENNIK